METVALTPALVVELLLLMLAANGAPILLARILGDRWAWPVDFGLRLRDGRPLFGHSKTWRGIVAGLVTCAAAAALFGYGPGFGLLFGGASLFGDLCSSFVKRRLGIVSSGKAIGLDQVPEALLPLLVYRYVHGLGWGSIGALVLFFFVGSLILSQIMFRIGVRKQPY
jgi:CDP-2,3-bis-(O-geranylgeranyl)-sn-glycerol synthase